MRVIAGTARRTALAAPVGIKTRPTTDRAKEGLFNVLSRQVAGASFLDLYCGSGQIGIEALSRGADFAFFVDSCPRAISSLRQNLEKTRLAKRGRYSLEKAESAIPRLAASEKPFDIVFLDPPYDARQAAKALSLVEKSQLLKAGGLVVVESKTKLVDNIPCSLYLIDERAYGISCFFFYRRKEAL